LVSQAPNLYFNVFHGRMHDSTQPGSMRTRRGNSQNPFSREKLNALIAAQKYVPPLWVSAGAGALAVGNPLPALLGTVGCLAIGAVGLRRSYRDTVQFYRGDPG